MSDSKRVAYVAAFALGLGDGVTLERYRAPRGGLYKMRLVHHESGVIVERDYDGSEPVFAVQNDLIRRIQAKLSEKGMNWLPAQDCIIDNKEKSAMHPMDNPATTDGERGRP